MKTPAIYWIGERRRNPRIDSDHDICTIKDHTGSEVSGFTKVVGLDAYERIFKKLEKANHEIAHLRSANIELRNLLVQTRTDYRTLVERVYPFIKLTAQILEHIRTYAPKESTHWDLARKGIVEVWKFKKGLSDYKDNLWKYH